MDLEFRSGLPSLESLQFNSVQSLSHVWFSATPWIAVCQASLPITNSQSSPKLMSIKSVMPSSHLILCHPLLLLPPIPPSISLFKWVNFASGGQSIGVSALASVLPMNTQDWSPLGWTGWTSLQSKGLSRVFIREMQIKNHNEVPFHTSQNGCYLKVYKQ